MWANGGFIKQGHFVVGQAEKVMILPRDVRCTQQIIGLSV